MSKIPVLSLPTVLYNTEARAPDRQPFKNGDRLPHELFLRIHFRAVHISSRIFGLKLKVFLTWSDLADGICGCCDFDVLTRSVVTLVYLFEDPIWCRWTYLAEKVACLKLDRHTGRVGHGAGVKIDKASRKGRNTRLLF